MKFKKVTVIYFSPTSGSLRNAMAVAEGTGLPMGSIDMTALKNAPLGEISFGSDEIVVLGAPCYGGRIPEIASSRFSLLEGNDTPCIVTVTYGKRHYDDALVELCDLAQSHGFIPIAAAALIAKHTYGHIAESRPDEIDLETTRLFGQKAVCGAEKAIIDVTPSVPGNRPYKDGGKGGIFRPSTTDACVKCSKCVSECPTGAISDDCRTIDNAKCLACFRCISVCPMKAKVMDSEEYRAFAEGFTQKLSVPRKNLYIL